ncbi:MAG: hypothetical protein ACRYGC_03705 [Janthinobacterium lividum]
MPDEATAAQSFAIVVGVSLFRTVAGSRGRGLAARVPAVRRA